MSPLQLPQIASRSWEHPADRAALNALHAIPGFDDVVRKIASYFGERGVRQLFLANAVRVGPEQRPRLHQMWMEVVHTLDWPELPELYVSQSPILNSMAVGFEKPFVIIHSGMLDELNDEEQRFVLAHEMAHIVSGHTTYRTIAIIALEFGLGSLPFLAGLVILPFQLALLEWYRKSELSSDRGGLLATQDPKTAMSAFLKMAGGKAGKDQISVSEFEKQADEYETGGGAWDTVMKLLNTAFREHPFATVRASELRRWRASGAYDRILAGEYHKRGVDDARGAHLKDDAKEAKDYYAERAKNAAAGAKDVAKDAAREVGDVVNRAKDAFTDAFRGGKR